MQTQAVAICPSIVIDRIHNIQYFEGMVGFSGFMPKENYWEMLYVDRGELQVLLESRPYHLTKGNLVFCKPNEEKVARLTGTGCRIRPDVVKIGFECHSPAVDFFIDRALPLNQTEHTLLAKMLEEARNAGIFTCNRSENILPQNKELFFGSQQLVELYLEHLLISLIRHYYSDWKYLVSCSSKGKSDAELYNRIVDYLSKNVYQHLTVEQIAKDNLIGCSQLQKLFKENNNCGVISYFSRLKIDTAKRLIRNNYLTFTQISDLLGYTSIHYFSRQFKKITGVTPTEYAESVQTAVFSGT